MTDQGQAVPKTTPSEGSGIEFNQAEQLDVLLNHSTEALNQAHETEETDASTTLK